MECLCIPGISHSYCTVSEDVLERAWWRKCDLEIELARRRLSLKEGLEWRSRKRVDRQMELKCEDFWADQHPDCSKQSLGGGVRFKTEKTKRPVDIGP